MISPARPETEPVYHHKPVLEEFVQRLVGAITQSPLLKLRLSKSGRLIDCYRLEQVTVGLSKALLEGVVNGAQPISLQLDLRALRERNRSDAPDPLLPEPEAGQEQLDETSAQEHLRLHRMLERISRVAELVKRETGRHALWLGYPLLYAPVFLWPIFVRLEALEVYEQRLARGEQLPVPPTELAADQYGTWWSALVEYTAVLMWEREWHSQHPVLLHVTPEVHQKTREELGNLLDKKRALEAATIQERWLERQLPYANGPWAKLFQLRSSKQNRAPRLREAVAASLPEGLLTLRPCWLVNPEAAAQIFPLQSGLFDLVVFDEASQCPIEQAIPAIYRGKTLIVSGDEKQLPPTDFFAARAEGNVAEDDDSDEEKATEDPVQMRERTLRNLARSFCSKLRTSWRPLSAANCPSSGSGSITAANIPT
jgi:hypothetical protein